MLKGFYDGLQASNKVEANAKEAFEAKAWKEASKLYSEAMRWNPFSNHHLYNKRAICYFHLEQYSKVLEDT